MVARPPTALTAASWDRLARDHLADGARGVIHSVFDRALNLRLRDGGLVGLVGPAAGNGPSTVVLAALPVPGFRSSAVTPGRPWTVADGRLVLGSGPGVGPSIVVELTTARVWHPAHVIQWRAWSVHQGGEARLDAAPPHAPRNPVPVHSRDDGNYVNSPVILSAAKDPRIDKMREPRLRSACRSFAALRMTCGDERIRDAPCAGANADDVPAEASAEAVSADEALVRLQRVEELASAVAPIGGLAALLPGVRSLVAECAGDAEPTTYSPDRATGQTTAIGLGLGAVPASPDPIAHRALTAAAELVHGWRAGDRQSVEAAATHLSGLGPGLTPSGDDLLAGFLVGVQRVGNRIEPALGAAAVAATQGRTTDIAIARVRHAADGLIEERVEDVLAVVLTGDGTDLESAVRRVAGWGHTSGVDTLVGLCLGLRLGLHDVCPAPTQ